MAQRKKTKQKGFESDDDDPEPMEVEQASQKKNSGTKKTKKTTGAKAIAPPVNSSKKSRVTKKVATPTKLTKVPVTSTRSNQKVRRDSYVSDEDAATAASHKSVKEQLKSMGTGKPQGNQSMCRITPLLDLHMIHLPCTTWRWEWLVILLTQSLLEVCQQTPTFEDR